MSSQIAPRTVAEIARVGVPQTIDLKAGTSVAGQVVIRCGTLDPIYVNILLADNKNPADSTKSLAFDDLKALRFDRPVEFPACARAPTTGTSTIGSSPSQQNISKIASANDIPLDPSRLGQQSPKKGETEGTAGAVLNDAVYDSLKVTIDVLNQKGLDDPNLTPWLRKYYAILNSQVVLDQNLDLKGLRPGTVVAVPALQPHWSSISLKAGVDRDHAIQTIGATLRTADAGGANQTQEQRAARLPDDVVQPNQFASLVGRVDAQDDSQVAGNCKGLEGMPWHWPFDVEDLLRVLALNNDERPQHVGTFITPILILDAGLDQSLVGNQSIPESYVDWVAPLAPLRGPVKAPSGTPVLGVNLSSQTNDPSTNEGYPDRFHGIAVSGAAIGTRSFEILRRLLKSALVQVAFANIIGRNGQAFTIDATQLANAFDFASERDIPIINASFTLTSSYQLFLNELKKYSDKKGLLVVAAGNDTTQERDLEAYRSWPAVYGGNPQNADGAAVITVGAHDEDGVISPFSKRGEHYVDLLAPGCKVPTYTGVAGKSGVALASADLAGTSFAAPLVSFVAGLIEDEGKHNGHEIKARLIVSVDEKPRLDHLVWSRGILNAWKALAIYNDVITIPGQNNTVTSRIGRFTSLPRLVTLCGGDISVSTLRKLTLTPVKDSDGFEVRSWTLAAEENRPDHMNRNGPCLTRPGDSLDDTGDFTDSLSGEELKIPIRSVRDWVPPMNAN